MDAQFKREIVCGALLVTIVAVTFTSYLGCRKAPARAIHSSNGGHDGKKG